MTTHNSSTIFKFSWILIICINFDEVFAQAGAPRFVDSGYSNSDFSSGNLLLYTFFLIAIWFAISQIIEALPIPESIGFLVYGCWFFFGLLGLAVIPPIYFISAISFLVVILFCYVKLSNNYIEHSKRISEKVDSTSVTDFSSSPIENKISEEAKFSPAQIELIRNNPSVEQSLRDINEKEARLKIERPGYCDRREEFYRKKKANDHKLKDLAWDQLCCCCICGLNFPKADSIKTATGHPDVCDDCIHVYYHRCKKLGPPPWDISNRSYQRSLINRPDLHCDLLPKSP